MGIKTIAQVSALFIQKLFEGQDPVFVVLGMEGVHAEGGGSLDVALAIVNEDGFLGQGLLTTKHHLEDLAIRLHHPALVAQIHGIEEMTDGMALAVEIAIGPLHHIGVGIREQADLIAPTPQAQQGLEITHRHMVDIAMPDITALIVRQRSAYQQTQFLAEGLDRDAACFKIAKDAFLLEGVKMATGIAEADFLKACDGLFITQGKHDAAQIECNIPDVAHIPIFII